MGRSQALNFSNAIALVLKQDDVKVPWYPINLGLIDRLRGLIVDGILSDG